MSHARCEKADLSQFDRKCNQGDRVPIVTTRLLKSEEKREDVTLRICMPLHTCRVTLEG